MLKQDHFFERYNEIMNRQTYEQIYINPADLITQENSDKTISDFLQHFQKQIPKNAIEKFLCNICECICNYPIKCDLCELYYCQLCVFSQKYCNGCHNSENFNESFEFQVQNYSINYCQLAFTCQCFHDTLAKYQTTKLLKINNNNNWPIDNPEPKQIVYSADEYVEHMNRGCKYRYIKCPLLCKPSQIHRMKYTAKDLLKHFQNECEEFIEICNNCNTSMKRKQMLNHVCENDCTKLYSHKQKDYSKFEFQQSIEMEETCLTEDTQESITPNQNQIITQNIKQLDKAAINYLNYKY